ncbi:Type IV secretory pathway, VirB10 components [Burkholderia sp. OK233]|nr:Type IV secretory pathway, VirB10 components [Burkholderia sp. OK233]
MAKQTVQPNPDQVAITKGKSPRNALIGVGVVIAVLVGTIGFYYQTQESSRADEERRAEKAARTAAAVEKPRSHDVDLDKMIADQAKAGQQQADAAAAASAAKSANPAAVGGRGATSLVTADAFLQDERTRGLANSAQSDSIYASPIFRPGVKVKEPAMSPAQAALASLPTPQQMALRQTQAEQGAVNNPALQAQLQALKALSGMGGAGGVGGAGGQRIAALSTTQDRDTQFMQNAGDQSSNGVFKRAGFVGQSRGCTLSPPHHINVLALEGLNSDRPGTASLVVENDVYDSLGNGCLMIPKGSTIVAPYSSDIQPGQETILVAATELRLPNGKQVPLYGAQGADPDGTAGFSGDVNNHFLKIYGASFLTAILLRRFNGGDTTTTSGPYGVSQVGSTAGQVAAQTSQSILNRYQNIPPTITDKPGTRFMIKVNRDITLEPFSG